MHYAALVMVYAVGLLPILVLSTIGWWPLRPWQVVVILLVLALPVVSVVDDSPLAELGWIGVYGVPWAVHLIAPWAMLFTTRARVRIAMPVTVIAVQPLYFATTGAIYLVVFATVPVLSAGFALLVAWGRRLDERDKAQADQALGGERETAPDEPSGRQ
ncbi:hypothetical protein [Kineococcus aurantiacus]|uniref:Uncharacterized protein n=1 Tax=Kineococcus aurantiacus TaxID=37633 RepID=A0A7Y9DQK6_9ACTN|nr:hypothetical protein [Kineococcus aurantiacus]NYD24985.1 hypothetical protein [Kineococcus aurantiacus]